MKKKIKKWTLGLTAAGLLIATLAIVLAVNPSLCYARHTPHGNFEIYHDQALQPGLLTALDDAATLLKTSEFYNPDLHLKICLDDNSLYPECMAKVRGEAFGWGFYNIVALRGLPHYAENKMEVNGRNWNLTQLLAHEAVHCLQYDALGLWYSPPIADIPIWKSEGYPEYIARRGHDQIDLRKNIDHLVQTLATDHQDWIDFADGSGAVMPYYKAWLLVQYCMDIKHLSYRQVLAEDIKEADMQRELMVWYLAQRSQYSSESQQPLP